MSISFRSKQNKEKAKKILRIIFMSKKMVVTKFDVLLSDFMFEAEIRMDLANK